MEQEPGMMIVTCTLLSSKFDTEVRKEVLNAAGRDATSKDAETRLPNGPQRAMVVGSDCKPCPKGYGSPSLALLWARGVCVCVCVCAFGGSAPVLV